MLEGDVGRIVRGQVVITSVEKRQASNGDFLAMVLYDGQDKFNAKWWQYSGELPPTDLVYHLVGSVAEFRGMREIHIRKMSPMDVPIENFRPTSKEQPEVLYGKCMELLESLEDKSLAATCLLAYAGAKTAISAAPAAKRIHHDYAGGLLEHSLEVAEYALSMGEGLNRDYLIAGGLMHDIGKLFCYDWKGVAIEETLDGALLGHIPLGMRLWFELCLRTNIDDVIAMQIAHIILSHHGRLEWGSPIEPSTGEALIIHLGDMASSQKGIVLTETDKIEQGWTDKIFPLGRRFFKSN